MRSGCAVQPDNGYIVVGQVARFNLTTEISVVASGSIEEPDLRLLFGDLRSGRVLGEDAGTIKNGADGDLRSGRVLGQETGTIRMGTGALGWVPPPL